MAATAVMKETFRKLIKDHPALLVSGLYVAASIVGMFYSWAFLRRFGINVFNYAQISDFLLVSLKEPFTWALVILAIVLVMLTTMEPRMAEPKPATEKLSSIAATSPNIAALMTRTNSPSVTMVNGNVSTIAIGRMKPFARPSSKAARINVPVPSILTPGNSADARKSPSMQISVRTISPAIC